MIISKVLNNNVVIATENQKEEIILMGNGLGYKARVGDRIDKERVEKVYRIEQPESVKEFEEHFQYVSEEIIEMTMELFTYTKEVLKKELNSMAFMAIADHIEVAVQRVKQGMTIRNFLLHEIKRFYPTEFQVSKEFLKRIEKRLNVCLSEDEAGFLAVHIVNAELDNDHDDAVQLLQLVEEILTVVKYRLHIPFDEEDISFQRFVTHLKFFAKKVLIADSQVGSEQEMDMELFALVKQKYPEAFEATKSITEYLKQRFEYDVIVDEQVYLTVHLARLLKDHNNRN